MDIRTTDILNDSLAIESRCLIARIDDATVFVSPVAAGDLGVVRRLVSQNLRHRELLVAMIVELGGQPRLIPADIATADLHYLDLRAILPDLGRSIRAKIDAYNLTATRIGADSAAAGLIRNLSDQHCAELSELEALMAAPDGDVASLPPKAM